MKQSYYFIGILLSFCFFFLQSQLNAQELIVQDSSKSETQEKIGLIQDGYSQNPNRPITGAISSTANEHFNRGIVSDPLLLVQGKVSGVQIYNRGGDPNKDALFRIRGLNGLAQNKLPLFVIDGIAGVSLSSIDPNDIGSISILKDASSQAIYGMRAANGVVLINTKSSNFLKDTFQVRYQGQVGVANILDKPSIFTADQFRQAGGFDLGSSNNWIDEITRSGNLQNHSLSLEGKNGVINYRLSGNYRTVEGTLNQSGFDRYNFRLNVGGALFNQKLKFNIQTTYTAQDRELAFTEALGYAIGFNPTAPISGANVPFAFNEDLFGGFYENIGLFDSFNPLAINSLNQRTGEEELISSAVHLSYEVVTGLAINLRYSNQTDFRNLRSFYSPTSYFLGNAFSGFPEIKGRGILKDFENNFQLYEAYLNFDKKINKNTIGATIGAAFHDGRYTETEAELIGFNSPEILEKRKIDNFQDLMFSASFFDSAQFAWNDQVLSYFASAYVDFNNKIQLTTSVRSDASSKLGANNQSGLFYSAGLSSNLKEILKINTVDQLNFRMAYGQTGGLPSRGGLSQEHIRITQLSPNNFRFDRDWTDNPDLGWEKKKEFNIGLDFSRGNFFFNIDWYNKTLSDWIVRENTDFFVDQYTNANALNASGVDLNLGVVLKDTKDTHFSTNVVLSFYRTEFDTIRGSPTFSLSPGGPIQDPLIVNETGQALGNIYAPRFSGNVNENGFPVFEDINEDGVLQTFPSTFGPDSDLENLGSGIPSLEFGWNAYLRHKSWEFIAVFRGAVGHLLVNRARQFHESFFQDNIVYNLLETDLKVDGLASFIFSSHWVEKADFVKLDNLTIAKNFKFSKRGNIRVSLTAQNLLVLTNYSGIDPEPALEDNGPAFIGQNLLFEEPVNPLAAGVDRRRSYLPARTFVFGLGLTF